MQFHHPAMRVCGLDHIVLNVQDVERSLDFYHRILGLPAERVEAWRKGDVGFPSVRVNDATIIDLFAMPDHASGEKLNLNHFCLVTERADLEAAAQELTQAGVTIERGPGVRSGARGDGLSVYFRDPDANLIELRTYTGV
jgi:catechol 2,3-dioxygenase-like lactoylglutathione lyase family enzyme